MEPQQIMVKAVIARGGNSRGVYLLRSQLPADTALRDKIILAIFGSPDIREIDGLGGATVLTSKVAIIGLPTRPDADIDYTFGQVSINEAHVDYSGNRGNIAVQKATREQLRQEYQDVSLLWDKQTLLMRQFRQLQVDIPILAGLVEKAKGLRGT